MPVKRTLVWGVVVLCMCESQLLCCENKNKGKVSQTQLVVLDVNETTCFRLLGHHQVCKSSKRLNIVRVWRMLRSHHLAYELCET